MGVGRVRCLRRRGLFLFRVGWFGWARLGWWLGGWFLFGARVGLFRVYVFRQVSGPFVLFSRALGVRMQLLG